MILIGVNKAIDAEKTIIFVKSIDEIAKTPAGSLIVADFSEADLEVYATARTPLAIRVNNIRDFLLLSATKAKYALAATPLADKMQKLADRYLYDIKVLAIASCSDIETIADLGIDG
ncbi:MAG: hypothetical protein LBC09_04460, partial [Helicobacteraceae bacterium]|nr:hypothetical protein [Helicobacteraceae bacterium]